eukprot:7895108-Prorocentrum_lima.AAC.1
MRGRVVGVHNPRGCCRSCLRERALGRACGTWQLDPPKVPQDMRPSQSMALRQRSREVRAY